MKTKGALLLMVLLLAFPGAHKVDAAGLRATHGHLAVLLADNIAIDCNSPALPPGFSYEVIPQASGTQEQAGNVLHTFLCNYNMKSQAGQLSGMAITIDYRCPADTQSNWATKTSPRSNEVTRTPNSLLTRATGSFNGFAGAFTVQEKLFFLIDTHTIATIVVLTDPNPNNPNDVVFSANAAQAPAIALAKAYAPQANDPACPNSASVPSTSGGTAPNNYNPTYSYSGPWEWEHVGPGTAAAVAVGVGAVAALLGGLLTGALGTSAAPVSRLATVTTAPAVAGPVPSGPPQTASLSPPSPPYPPPVSNAVGPPPPQASPPLTSPPAAETLIAEAALTTGAATAGAVSSVAASSSSGEGQQSEDKGGEQEEVEKPCPEVQAQLFGLPANNSRNDCPGSRPSMGPWCAGIDFTSKDEHGTPANLDFEALVSGEVTYLGDSDNFNMIEVKLENGNRIQYLHASEVYVQVGQHIGHSTKLGKTGGTGPRGPNHYEIHLHVQAIDKDGNLIDPDCALASMDSRKLRTGDSPSPYRERISKESKSELAEAKPAPIPPLEEEHAALLERSALSVVEPEVASSTLPFEPSPTPTQTSPAQPVAPTERPIFCADCGQANPRAARFCLNCGRPIRHA